MAKKNDDVLKTKVWVRDDTGFKFPEKVRQSTGVCFSGCDLIKTAMAVGTNFGI